MQQGQQVRVRIAALGLVALAFFARVYRLGDKNIWWDEGWTVWMGQHDWAWIALRTASDEHPPLHYWLMNMWQTVFGTEAFTGRFFSLIFGVLLVALIYRIGKHIGGVWLGLLAALFLALARFNVWWSQDIKNYTLSAFFAWASVWFVWKYLFSAKKFRGNFFAENKYLIGYVVATTVALYSHYLAILIVFSNNLFVGIYLLAEWRRGASPVPMLGRWVAAQLAVVVLFAPWLVVYLQNGATWSAAPTFDFGLFLQLAATVLLLGVTTFIENYTVVVLALLFIAALSLGWFLPSRSLANRSSPVIRHSSSVLRPSSALARGTAFMLLIALIPPALIYVLALTPAAIFAPKIQARYLMMLTPAVALLLALGVLWVAENFRTRAAQVLAAVLVVFVVGAQVSTLRDYFRERFLKDEYLTVSQMINNFGFESDAIVLNTDQEYPTFLYYLKRPMEWVGVPNGARVDEGTAQRVAAQALQHDAVWVVTIPDALQQDPTRMVEQKIEQGLKKQYERTFGDKRLALYTNGIRNVKDVPRANFTPQQPRSDTFDDRLKLVGLDLPVREAFVGDVVSVVTYWAAQDLTTINVSLEKPNGEIVARAAIPISIGAFERAQADLQVPPDTDVRELRVFAQARLNKLQLGTLRILQRDGIVNLPDDMVNHPRTERFGQNIHLTSAGGFSGKFRAGQEISGTLVWQTDAPIPTGYSVFVHLLGEQYNPAQNNFLWGQVDRIPADGKFPTTAWQPGSGVFDSYQVKIDPKAPPGLYRVEIGLYDATGTRLHVFDDKGNDNGDALILNEFEVVP